MKHGAIETSFKGYRFRSRLEARWAVFLDSVGIEWQYEPQGYEAGEHRYLPDFYLPDSKVWLEVKGDPSAITADRKRMLAILGDASPLPGFVDGESAVVVVGDVPETHDGCTLHTALARVEGSLTVTWSCFIRTTDGAFRCVVMAPHLLFSLFRIPTRPIVDESAAAWSLLPSVFYLKTPGNWPEIRDAYAAARRARFEHGEHGR